VTWNNPRSDELTRMGPPSLGYRPALDGIRGLAVLGVIAQHAQIPGAGNAGTAGVTLFFVLSGFLITRILVDEHETTGRIDLRRFYVRRAARLLPALVVFLVVMTPLLVVSRQPLSPVVVAAMYSSNIAMVLGMPMGVLAHLWSLAMEEQFYLLWPLLLAPAAAARARPWMVAGLSVATAVSVAHRVSLELSGASDPRVMFGPDTRADALLIGCLLALATLRIPRVDPLVAVFGGLVFIACLPLGPQGSWTLLPVALASGAVIAWAVTAQATSSALLAVSSRPLRGLGRISYGVYLWHLPLALLLSPHLTPWALAAATLAVSVGLAAASWRFVEQPMLRRFPRRHGAAWTTGERGPLIDSTFK
jgi:peptidoglycan/LPS O-acetylase OafA/YrhL